MADATGVRVDGGMGVNVDNGTAVNVGVLTAGAEVGVLFAANCACTVNAAAVSMASGSAGLGWWMAGYRPEWRPELLSLLESGLFFAWSSPLE